jgi:hypothetical protein
MLRHKHLLDVFRVQVHKHDIGGGVMRYVTVQPTAF